MSRYGGSVIGDEPKLPLFDVNEVFLREITASECQDLVDLGQAEITPFGVKLTPARDVSWSLSCFTAREAQLAAGEFGDSEEAGDVRAKLHNWTPTLADRIVAE